MIGTEQYTKLVTSEHNQRPNFMAMVELLCGASADLQNQYANIPNLFDINEAVADQLDKLGAWIGASRFLNTSVGGTIVLVDVNYRILLQAVIASNHWDGTVPGAYRIWAIVFALEGFSILIQDYCDMSMAIIFLTTTPVDPVTLALLVDGYIALRPAGVLISGYFEPGGPGPIFGFDVENSLISGFDVGTWALQIA